MRRMKSTARPQKTVAASSSNSEEDVSLVLITARNLRQLVMLPLLARFHSTEAVCLHSGVNSPVSTKHNGRMDLSM